MFNIVNENEVEDFEIEVNDDAISLDYLLKAIQDLPDRYRLVLDGYSHKEIADMLNITTGTSKSNLSRARHILKQAVENYTLNENIQSL